MAAASDLAAMGARPRGALSALTLPDDVDDQGLADLAKGQASAAVEVGTSIVGGNLSRGPTLSITTTLLGEAGRPLRRDGAHPGDSIAIAGDVGLARAGLVALLQGTDLAAATDPVRGAVGAWQRPRAQLAAGTAAADAATAAIDVSDGLVIDAWRLGEASGVGLELDGPLLASPLLRAACSAIGLDPMETALYGGDDYALLVTFPPALPLPAPFRPIGRCIEGSGVVLRADDGRTTPLAPRGYDHFRA
jgi:thiamine-monophosphate kinase